MSTFEAWRSIERETWTALWLRVELICDPGSVVRHFKKPLLHRDVLVLDEVLPASVLLQLLASMRRGRLAQGFLPTVPSIDLAWPPRSALAIQSFGDHVAPRIHYEHLGLWPSQVSITLDPGSLIEWWRGSEPRCDFLRRIDNTFETLGFGRLTAVGVKLDLLDVGSPDFTENSMPLIRIVAPLPARIVSVQQERQGNDLVVTLQVGTTYPKGRLGVRFIESGGSKRNPRKITVGRKKKIVVSFRRPIPGDGEILLFDDLHGTIGRRRGQILPPYRLRPRIKVLGLPDPDLEQIRKDLRCTTSEEHERSVALALYLLGFSTAWWGRRAKMPKGIQTGTDAHDLVASTSMDSAFFVLECSATWIGDDKLAKLIGRSNRIRNALAGPGGGAPMVIPFVAIAQNRGDIPPATAAALARHQVGLLAADDIEELLDLVTKGASDVEVSKRLAACMSTQQRLEDQIAPVWEAPRQDWS